MPSVIQKRSYSSVTVYSIDEQAIWTALERFAGEAKQRPEVTQKLSPPRTRSTQRMKWNP